MPTHNLIIKWTLLRESAALIVPIYDRECSARHTTAFAFAPIFVYSRPRVTRDSLIAGHWTLALRFEECFVNIAFSGLLYVQNRSRILCLHAVLRVGRRQLGLLRIHHWFWRRAFIARLLFLRRRAFLGRLNPGQTSKLHGYLMRRISFRDHARRLWYVRVPAHPKVVRVVVTVCCVVLCSPPPSSVAIQHGEYQRYSRETAADSDADGLIFAECAVVAGALVIVHGARGGGCDCSGSR